MSANNSATAASSNPETSQEVGERKPAELRVNLDSDDESMLNDNDDVHLLRDVGPRQRRDSSASDASNISTVRKHWKKGVVSIFTIICVAGPIVADVENVVKSHEVSDKMENIHHQEVIRQQSQQRLESAIQEQQQMSTKLIKFVEDTGILTFESYSSQHRFYAAVLYVNEKSHSQANAYCSYMDASLAEPTSQSEFNAIALAARKSGQGKCLLGPTRNKDGGTWTTDNGNSISLDPFWGNNQPSKSVLQSCVFLLSVNNSSTLATTQCSGNYPPINCMICQRNAPLYY